ncbi:MAG TPA: hypothetical protein VLW50_24995 [Streptosporangiaceae bacterium]|nr:hypothetical protein [Streptosporangiaceae bacterium]
MSRRAAFRELSPRGEPAARQPASQLAAAKPPRHHSWDEDKTCRTCGLQAVTRSQDATGNRTAVYQHGTRRFVSARTPPCGGPLPEPADSGVLARLAQDADYHAGLAWRAGDYDRAARLIADARVLDPADSALWDLRERRISAEKERPENQAPAQLSLAEETAQRLAAAGFTESAPAITDIRHWNVQARMRAGIEAARPGGREAEIA